MSSHALVIGSAPVAETLKQRNLSAFTRVAINKSWQLRPDFDILVGLTFMRDAHALPDDYPARRITKKQYGNALRIAGGQFLCAPSVALIAGYWGTAHLDCDTMSFFGCDLVFNAAANDGRTHFYGVSDEGPLFNRHPCMRRQDLRSARLFAWGLMHRVVMLNASNLPGTLLRFPAAPLERDRAETFRQVMASPVAGRIIRRAGNALAYEQQNRTPAFDGRWKAFAEDPQAVDAVGRITQQWEPVAELCDKLGQEVAAG